MLPIHRSAQNWNKFRLGPWRMDDQQQVRWWPVTSNSPRHLECNNLRRLFSSTRPTLVVMTWYLRFDRTTWPLLVLVLALMGFLAALEGFLIDSHWLDSAWLWLHRFRTRDGVRWSLRSASLTGSKLTASGLRIPVDSRWPQSRFRGHLIAFLWSCWAAPTSSKKRSSLGTSAWWQILDGSRSFFFYCFAFGSSCERGKVDNAAQRHGHRFFHSSLADGWRRVEAPITRRSTDDARSSKEMLGLLIDDGGRFSFVFVFVFVFVFTWPILVL